MNIAVVDDEKVIMEQISGLARKQMPDYYLEFYATGEGQLGEDFYRCHQVYIVNMAHITEYDNDSITITNGDRVYLTKKKYGDFVKAYMWYMQNGGIPGV